MSRHNVRTAAAVLSVLIVPSILHAQTAHEFTGRWVMMLANKPLLVLQLSSEPDNNAVAGYLLRPEHLQTSDGVSFSRIANKTSRRPIVHSELVTGVLSITVQNPADASDKDRLRIRLLDPFHVAVTFDSVPFAAWTFTKTTSNVVPASDWDEKKSYSDEDALASSAEMQRIFEEDQRGRQPGQKIDWERVSKSDEQRRAQTKKLLEEGALHTGEDFERAAFIFQHGSTPNDYLLAHTLAMIAVKKGDGGAIWIATATLDRYLQNIGKPQIYGTQFLFKEGGTVTQDPYDRELISDALRRTLGVPSQKAQEEQRKQYEAEQKKERK